MGCLCQERPSLIRKRQLNAKLNWWVFVVVFSLLMYFSSVQENIALQARQWKLQITGQNVREKYKGGLSLLERVKSLIHDVRRVGLKLQLTDILQPQHALPDVFIWMISGNKRVAYHRITSRCQKILNDYL